MHTGAWRRSFTGTFTAGRRVASSPLYAINWAARCPGLVPRRAVVFRPGRATGSDKCTELDSERDFLGFRGGVPPRNGLLWCSGTYSLGLWSMLDGILRVGTWALGFDLNASGGLLVV